MEYQNGQYISAYTENDIIFEGKVYTRNDGTKVVLNESKKWIPVSKLKLIRVIESEETDISSLVDSDLADKDMDKLGALDDTALDKLGGDREKELVTQGIKIKDGEYKNGFVSKIKATKVANDVEAGNISDSEALEKYKQSKDVDIEMRIKKTLKETLGEDDFDADWASTDFDDEDFSEDFDDEFTDEDYEFDLDSAADAFEEIYNQNDDEDFDEEEYNLLDSDIIPVEESCCKKKDCDCENCDCEEDISKKIEEAIDEYAESVEIYDDSKMFEHVCLKFGFEPKQLLKENNYSIADSIMNMAEKLSK